MVKVGSILQAVRVRSGLTQEDMADKLNMSQSCISKIEKDRKMPEFNIILKWVEITNAKEVMVAFIYGIDGVSMIQSVMQLLGG